MSDVGGIGERGGPAPGEGHARPGAIPASTAAGGLLVQLEERIEALVERHRESRGALQELRSALGDRDAAVASLEERIESADKLRSELRHRVGKLIEQVAEFHRHRAEVETE